MTASSQDLQDAFLWQIGSVADASWGDIPLMLAMVIVASVIVQLSYRSLNLLSLGDDTARSLGLDVSQYRMLCILLVSLLVASIISFTGVIGFVGLVAPHMVRFMIGGDNRFVIPASICVGALILVFADLVSRWFYGIASVPIGVVMSFIGAPVFLLLVLRRNSLREAV